MRPSVFLPIFCLLFSPHLFAGAQDIDSETEVLARRFSQEIFYSKETFQTATRSPQRLSHVTDQVTVITREELEKWPVRDLDEALGFINGIVMTDDGHLAQAATPQIYGSKPREVRVLVDGITLNATSTGGIADISQIPLEIVEKIEVVKGASSSAWGSALGGVIHIITKPGGKNFIPTFDGSLSWGEFDTERQTGEVSGNAGGLSYYVFGSNAQSEGFRPSSKEFEKRAFLKADLPLGEEWKVFGSFGYSGTENDEFDLPLSNFKFRRKVYSHYGQAGAAWQPAENLHHQVAYKLSERKFRRDRRILSTMAPSLFTKAQSVIHEVTEESIWDITDNQTIALGTDIGVEVLNSAIFSGGGATIINDRKSSTRHGYYTNYQLSWKAVDFTAGSRLDFTNSYGESFNPSAGVVIHLPFWQAKWRSNVAKAFNAPSFVDRYVSVETTVANPDLEAEKAVGYNTGLDMNPLSWLQQKATFFQTFLEDSIILTPRSDGTSQYINIDSERRTGFETETALGPWYGFSPSYGTMFVSAVDPGKGPLQGRPRFTQDIKLNYGVKLWDTVFNAHIAGRYMDLVTGYGPTDPSDQAFIFDGKLMVKLPQVLYTRWTLFLLAENLFNEDFSFDAGNDPNPQRNFEAGFRVRISP